MSGHSAFQMFENRLKKLFKEKAKWAKKESIEAYRLYDKDIPQIPALIDVYKDKLHISILSGGYEQSNDERIFRENQLKEIIETLPEAKNFQKYYKFRERKKGLTQYESFSEAQERFWVKESGLEFQVDMVHSLDSGLFLDHRWARSEIRKKTKGKSFLNLFCYTGSFTVYAVAGGASSSRSIDLSHTYLTIAEENLRKNGLQSPEHEFVRSDALEYLRQGSSTSIRNRYDLIFLDPPTFSNSKSMNTTWDIQRDHSKILNLLFDFYLKPEGEIYFSTNSRKFKLNDSEINWESRNYQMEDLTEISIPADFRDRKIHKLYRFFPS